MTSVGAVGILRAQSSVGRIFVDHGVHAARCNAEEEPRAAQLLEIPVVSVPVGLRDDSHTIARRFKGTSDYGRAE